MHVLDKFDLMVEEGDNILIDGIRVRKVEKIYRHNGMKFMIVSGYKDPIPDDGKFDFCHVQQINLKV